MSSPLLSVRLRAGYGKTAVLDGMEFTMQRGERLGLIGPSGAGKSTLVTALLGLLPWRNGWASGEVLLNGVNLLELPEREARRLRGKEIALVPQSPMSALNSAVSLRRHFEAAWRAHEPAVDQRFNARLAHLLEQVRLPGDAEFLARKPGGISVGQAQRVVVALALLHRPALLIADEPTSALDPATQADLLDLLRKTNSVDGAGVLYISHDVLSVLQFAERLAVLHHGRIAECVPVRSLAEGDHHPAMMDMLRLLPVPLALLVTPQRGYADQGITPIVDACATSE